ncbi:glycosyltransferase family 2 protein [Neolewinella maritima]|uniref:glycosyltransferase family 2 protein n=1 Tax=Neolewinella maritima TaxID=1383882 RepID=UPI001EE9A2FE|nr:glycosyltransferase family 2 protein [Neolewinella maritima]
MQLSIVIVSYNVRYFLEQCLLSVERATEGMETETWVVDNNSADGSVELVRRRFPWVRVIANTANPGFSIANNQALRQSSGKYMLLLNPDTVVQEDTFRRCYAFSEAHPELGGLGVTMIDGSGRFLPESKRGLPTPWVAFTKAFGLARLFPRSRRFNHYHLGYLPADETHPIEVLAGAYMWLRAEALEKVGLLDEAFFMYGEDIDLSYRLLQGGYQNYYFPETSIIHYKGESTKRGSLNYVRVFYQAMIIFARKHFVGSQARLLVWMMQLAVYVRATLTVVSNLWQRLRFPLVDAVGIYLGLRLLKQFWSAYQFGDPTYFPETINYLHFPAYTLLWIGSIFLGGGYDRPYAYGRLLRSLVVGTLLLLAIYALLPEVLRPSRALLVLGAAWATAWTLGVRTVASLFSHGTVGAAHDRRLVIVGGTAETQRTLSLLQRAGAVRNYLGRIAPTDEAWQTGAHAGAGETIGSSARLETLVALYRVEELIFCSADLDNTAIQRWMSHLGPGVQYRILPEASGSIIGSHQRDRRGTLYTIDVNLRISDPTYRRGKWLFDRLGAVCVLLLSPVLVWFVDQPLGLLRNALRVLLARESWVGYHPDDPQRDVLPPLRTGVLWPGMGAESLATDTLHHLNLLYARDYGVGEDWRLIVRHLRQLGR